LQRGYKDISGLEKLVCTRMVTLQKKLPDNFTCFVVSLILLLKIITGVQVCDARGAEYGYTDGYKKILWKK